MGSFKKTLFLTLSSLSLLFSDVEANRIDFLIASKEWDRAMNFYLKRAAAQNCHDSALLKNLAQGIISQAITSSDPKEQLRGLYGLMISATSDLSYDFSKLIHSPDLYVQMLTLQYLSQWHDDAIERWLHQAMSSPFLPVRIIALGQLVEIKSPLALMHIESLYYRMPPFLRPYFAPYYAELSTPDSLKILRQMLSDSDPQMKIAALLAIKSTHRDDFTDDVRKILTQKDPLLTETALNIAGIFQDSKSKPVVTSFIDSPYPHVQLAALNALKRFNDPASESSLMALANQGNIFAITSIYSIEKSEETLVALCRHPDVHVRINALGVLLEKRDPRAGKFLIEFLQFHSLHDGLNFTYSPGRTQQAVKLIPAYRQHYAKSKEAMAHIEGSTRSIRQQLILTALELDEAIFLEVAQFIFDHELDDLIPLVVKLLENCNSEKTFQMLQVLEQKSGSPKTRLYAQMALARKKSLPHQQAMIEWLISQSHHPLIELSMLKSAEKKPTAPDRFMITADEQSELMLEAFESVVAIKSDQALTALVETLQKSPQKNKAVLAGYLLKGLL